MPLTSEQDAEVLGNGDADRPPRRWPWLVLATAVALLAVGAAVDGPLRDRESAALADAAVAAERALDEAEALVVSRVEYAAPLLSYGDPGLRAEFGRLVRDGAGQGVDAAGSASDIVDAVTVLPWHTDLAEARTALARYVDARLALLSAVAADERARARLTDAAAATDLAAARAALDTAVTDPAAAARIDAALAPR